MDNPLIEIKRLTHIYPDGTKALDQLSLTIEEGKKIAVLGNNGAGKSTFFLHLNGLLQPNTGELLYKGNVIKYDRRSLQQLRRQVGLVFQNPDTQLFSPTVLDDIMYGPRHLGLSKEEAQQAAYQIMERTELIHLQEKPPHFLSIGQKKRVAIAGVAVMNPDLLILDEPTAGLDPFYAKQMMALLSHLKQPKQTVLLSTHDVNLAYEWADEIIVLQNGYLRAHGTPNDIFQETEMLRECHLEQPWIVEVFLSWNKAHKNDEATFPKTKEELVTIITK